MPHAIAPVDAPPVADSEVPTQLREAHPVVGHVLDEYLSASGMFIHTLLSRHRRFRPVVLAGRTNNLSQFPFDAVIELTPPDAATAVRAWRRLTAYAAGCRTAAEHRIRRSAGALGCAVLHAHWGQMGYSSLRARRRHGIPIITSFYGHDLAAPRRAAVWGERYERLFEEGDLFLCEGPAMGRNLADLGCPEEKIRVHGLGLDLSLLPFAPRARVRPLVILQVARFVEKKGIDVSIRAFAAARSRLGSSELWLVGDGPQRDELEALATKLGVGHAVRFLGMLSHAQHRDAMQRAHIGIQPSRIASDGDTEGGAPVTMLEMQAVGIPVVGTKHADLPFVVPRPEELVDEDDADALAEVLVGLADCSDEEWRLRVAEVREFIEQRHDADVTAGLTEGLYAELVADRRVV